MLKLMFVILIPVFASAQDTLHLFQGKKQIVHILTMDDSVLSYKHFYNINGPVYNLPMRNVRKIVFLNGRIFINESALEQEKHKEKLQSFETGKKHHVAVNTFDVLYNTLTIQYLYMFKSNTYGIRIPVSIGAANFNHNEPKSTFQDLELAYYNQDKLYSTGIDFLIFPFKKPRQFKFFTGPSIEYSRFRFKANNNNSFILERKSHSKAALIQFGFLLRNSGHFHFSFGAALGAFNQVISGYNKDAEFEQRKRELAYRLYFNLGYMFN